jgi:hypothetical protein
MTHVRPGSGIRRVTPRSTISRRQGREPVGYTHMNGD